MHVGRFEKWCSQRNVSSPSQADINEYMVYLIDEVKYSDNSL